MAESDPALVQTEGSANDAATANVRVASLENRLGEADRLAHLESRVSANEQQHRDRERAWQSAVDSVKEILETRLDGMDKATELLSEQVNSYPTDMDKAITSLRNVIHEQFASVDSRFRERDDRVLRESRDNKDRVDAAFAAQKEAASEQNKANQKAIDKSEEATTEAIGKLGELFGTNTGALADKVDDVKGRVQAIESGGAGRGEARVERRADTAEQTASFGQMISLGAAGLLFLSVVIAAIALVVHG